MLTFRRTGLSDGDDQSRLWRQPVESRTSMAPFSTDRGTGGDDQQNVQRAPVPAAEPEPHAPSRRAIRKAAERGNVERMEHSEQREDTAAMKQLNDQACNQ